MAWVAFDRAIKSAQAFKLDGPLDRWRSLRDEICSEVLERGFDRERGAFIQCYGSKPLDARLLLLPAVGFLPPGDRRRLPPVAALQREVLVAGSGERPDDGGAAEARPPS